ncbi:hypothetical protein NQ318_014975 [Aromia moschata]|uniref:Regulatory protein zeste n=1 Tax=Aromia moschata TaxID=1265417 RepID=A0AAV8YVY3_9CUCU|nr:hypothetical protein NQ318_014975 [Aromia moschata]
MADVANRKIRKSNFSPEEIETLVNTVVKHYNILYGEFAKRAINKQARHRAWLDVTKQVNRVSIERRTLQEVKNKWKKCQHLYRGQDLPPISDDFVKKKMKAKSKHRSNKNGKRLQIRQCSYYEPDFKKAVVLYAEQKSTSEAKRRYGISESNIRRWRRLKNDIMEKAAQARPARKCKKANNMSERFVEDFDVFDISNSLDSMPLEQRLSKNSTEEPVLQSQPLSPTKLKVTRQGSRPSQSSPKPVTPDPPNEEVCLRWNSHHSNMQNTFPNLLLREQYVDATLVAEGQTLKCHRLILSSCSPYFEEVLSGISPFQHPVLFMKDVPFWILKSLCDFMYAGEVHIFQNKLEELLAVADTLKIKGLAGKQDGATEEIKSPELLKQPKEEKREEKETRERKKHPQGTQQGDMPAPKMPRTSKSNQRRGEKANREPPKADDILDPLDLLEPVYEELTKESKPSSVQAKLKENKFVHAKRGLPKKFKKRKLPEEREESPPPLFLSRKGTRSRPNVKIPKYYHPTYDRASKSGELPESTIVREPHTDPLMQVEDIKAEPLDVVDDVIEIEDNVVAFSDHEMPLHDEEIMGDYDSPIVNLNEKDDQPFQKIGLMKPPIIMDVHTITEKGSNTLKIVDVAQLKSPPKVVVDPKPDDPLATATESGQERAANDPLNLNAEPVQKGTESITIASVETVVDGEVNSPEKEADQFGFRIKEVTGGQTEVNEEEEEGGGNRGSRLGSECRSRHDEQWKGSRDWRQRRRRRHDWGADKCGARFPRGEGRLRANSRQRRGAQRLQTTISEDCASELGFQITNVVSGHFDDASNDGKGETEAEAPPAGPRAAEEEADVADFGRPDGAADESQTECGDGGDETGLIAKSLEELLEK